jgi:RNA polymerase sigma-70 factor (ECF subfamily)
MVKVQSAVIPSVVMTRQESVDLLERARQADREALDDLFERAAGKLLALIRLRLGPELRRQVESRDVLQDVMLKACGGIEQLRGDGTTSFMGWLARIAENEIRDLGAFHRRERRDVRRGVALEDHPAMAANLVAEVRSATSRLVLAEEASRLERALESLSEEYREVIVLRRYEELSFPEIGERLGKSADASRMLFARAMAALTLKLGSGEDVA